MNADTHSHARPGDARVTHVALDLYVDFEARVLRGTAALDLDVAPGATEVVLDARRLAIRSVRDGDGAELSFTLGPDDPVLGSSFAIALPASVGGGPSGSTRRIVIVYETASDAEALQWLEPGQTAGRSHPFLFTQGHAIHTRSWIPLQDSPAIRFTYEARITVPAPLVAVMSAQSDGEPTADEESASRTFCFDMPEAIPAYLVALAVGDIAMHHMGPRTAVFAEPALLARAAHELGEMERMIDAAEHLVGPYLWGRFDVLVMPPSFPYGGMENPRLTFASPTLLAGDRSLTTVIAHELAHAWAGNLVTNATWNDFWINEGTTVYLELRLNEALWGAERADMLRSSGFRDLCLEIARMGESAPDTRLRYDMAGRDPAEGVTVVPYLKGAAFFWTLERTVGRARLDAWLRSWFSRQAFRSVTTDTLLADLREHLLEPAEATALDLDAWVDLAGVPADGAPPPSALMVRIDEGARRVLAGEAPSALDVAGWTPQAWRHFLGTLLAASPTADIALALDAAFSLGASRNAEVEMPWLRLAARCEMASAVPAIERFLGENGRMKYLRPLYAELAASSWGAPVAKRVYAASRDRYHALVRAGLDRLVGSPQAGSGSIAG